MADIFLSYSSKDKDRVKPLVIALEREGWTVWWDRKIPASETFVDQMIERELSASRCVVVVWSLDSVQSRWVRAEAEEGLGRRALLPVKIDQVVIPVAFRKKKAVDLFGWGGDPVNPEFQHLVQSIKEKIGQGENWSEAVQIEITALPTSVLEPKSAADAPARMAGVTPGTALKTKTVFISYSTKDKAIAAKVRAVLAAQGIAVTIDSNSMPVGGDIRSFIDKSIRETQVTLSIISRNSLESDWVALESVQSFAAEKYIRGKKFIGCYIDDQFLNRSFLIDAVQRIDVEIEELGKLITKGIQLNVDTVDIQTIMSRKYTLRNNLSGILNRLRGSLALDIREPEFEQSMQRIVAEIARLEDPK